MWHCITNDNWGIDSAHNWFNYKKACKYLNFDIQDNAQDVYENAVSCYLGQGIYKKYRSILINVLKYCNVFVENCDMKLALANKNPYIVMGMIQNGGDPRNIPHWERYTSDDIANKIINHFKIFDYKKLH